MNLRLLTTPLLATGLLLSTLGCSKKEEDAKPTNGTASYKLDGVTRTCQVTATITNITNNSTPNDLLHLTLTTIPEPAGGKEVVNLYLSKAVGQPTSAYQPYSFDYSGKSVTSGAYLSGILYNNITTSISQTSGGGFSGTFKATTNPTVYGPISDGVYTDVRP